MNVTLKGSAHFNQIEKGLDSEQQRAELGSKTTTYERVLNGVLWDKRVDYDELLDVLLPLYQDANIQDPKLRDGLMALLNDALVKVRETNSLPEAVLARLSDLSKGDFKAIQSEVVNEADRMLSAKWASSRQQSGGIGWLEVPRAAAVDPPRVGQALSNEKLQAMFSRIPEMTRVWLGVPAKGPLSAAQLDRFQKIINRDPAQVTALLDTDESVQTERLSVTRLLDGDTIAHPRGHVAVADGQVHLETEFNEPIAITNPKLADLLKQFEGREVQLAGLAERREGAFVYSGASGFHLTRYAQIPKENVGTKLIEMQAAAFSVRDWPKHPFDAPNLLKIAWGDERKDAPAPFPDAVTYLPPHRDGSQLRNGSGPGRMDAPLTKDAFGVGGKFVVNGPDAKEPVTFHATFHDWQAEAEKLRPVTVFGGPVGRSPFDETWADLTKALADANVQFATPISVVNDPAQIRFPTESGRVKHNKTWLTDGLPWKYSAFVHGKLSQRDGQWFVQTGRGEVRVTDPVAIAQLQNRVDGAEVFVTGAWQETGDGKLEMTGPQQVLPQPKIGTGPGGITFGRAGEKPDELRFLSPRGWPMTSLGASNFASFPPGAGPAIVNGRIEARGDEFILKTPRGDEFKVTSPKLSEDLKARWARGAREVLVSGEVKKGEGGGMTIGGEDSAVIEVPAVRVYNEAGLAGASNTRTTPNPSRPPVSDVDDSFAGPAKKKE